MYIPILLVLTILIAYAIDRMIINRSNLSDHIICDRLIERAFFREMNIIYKHVNLFFRKFVFNTQYVRCLFGYDVDVNM